MPRNYNLFENEEYKFVEYSGVLKDIRDSFMEELCDVIEDPHPFLVNRAFYRTYLKHSTLQEVLKTYVHVDPMKTNAILIANDTDMTSHGLLSNDKLFMDLSIKVLDRCKRNLPLLIKRVDCDFCDLNEFLKTGEGIEFLLQVDCDREKLRKYVCSFAEFRKFAKDEKLLYIVNNLLNKIEFKRLFIS